MACLVWLFEFDAVRMLRADVSLAISASISYTILAVSTDRFASSIGLTSSIQFYIRSQEYGFVILTGL
jgi:hypothetical protein